jgi:hypothetical protein
VANCALKELARGFEAPITVAREWRHANHTFVAYRA